MSSETYRRKWLRDIMRHTRNLSPSLAWDWTVPGGGFSSPLGSNTTLTVQKPLASNLPRLVATNQNEPNPWRFTLTERDWGAIAYHYWQAGVATRLCKGNSRRKRETP